MIMNEPAEDQWITMIFNVLVFTPFTNILMFLFWAIELAYLWFLPSKAEIEECKEDFNFLGEFISGDLAYYANKECNKTSLLQGLCLDSLCTEEYERRDKMIETQAKIDEWRKK